MRTRSPQHKCAAFYALSAFIVFRFSASARASGSVFRVLRVPERSGAFRSVILVLRVLLAYGDNVLAGMVSGGPKMALL